MKEKIAIFWFRRDLRLNDNHGLFKALKSGLKVLPIFIFDTEILDKLEDKSDQRVYFIHKALQKLNEELNKKGSNLEVWHGSPLKVWQNILEKHSVAQIFTNHDYEPYAIERDEEVKEFLGKHGAEFFTFKDQVIFEKKEIVKDNGKPYTVFTPYSKKWLANFESKMTSGFDSENEGQFVQSKPQEIMKLEKIGFKPSDKPLPPRKIKLSIIKNYHETRDYPAIEGTTHLSVHLRFGTVSIRKLVEIARKHNKTWLNELIWREFYMMILFNFPYVAEKEFKEKYQGLTWAKDKKLFKRWCEGKTGFPIVDAGMRELNATGYMHNRVRMITASFLVKDLLIDWRMGERYFAEKLLDFELSSNNGGWQWAAGTGCDAAPYFRIFNPESQQKKFDPDCKYIKKWVPEYDTEDYPEPIVDHKKARQKALEFYKQQL